MSKTYLTAFNNLVIKFNQELINTFPEENDFKVYKKAIILLNKTNAKKICLLFKSYSNEFRDQIIQRNEEFFLTKNYKEMVFKDSNGIESIVNKLKNYWTQLSVTNKDNIWKYLNTLLKLSDLIE